MVESIRIDGVKSAGCDQIGSVVAEAVGVVLPELLAATVTVKVAIGANVHDDVEDIRRTAEMPGQVPTLFV